MVYGSCTDDSRGMLIRPLMKTVVIWASWLILLEGAPSVVTKVSGNEDSFCSVVKGTEIPNNGVTGVPESHKVSTSVSVTQAASKAIRPRMDIVYISSSAGYVRLATQKAWNMSHTTYPPLPDHCVTVTPPGGHVIFFTFLSLEVHEGQRLEMFPCVCGSQAVLHKRFSGNSLPQPFIFPDVFTHRLNQTLSVSFRLGLLHDGDVESCGGRVRFSFHPAEKKPTQLTGDGPRAKRGEGLWNCCVSVWPELFRHFPCDLKAQCAGYEDERPCSYTSDQCGPDRIDAGGTCYLLQWKSLHTYHRANKVCREHGGILPSLETPRQWHHFWKLLRIVLQHKADRTNRRKPWFSWTGATRTRQDGAKSPHWNSLYTHTWQWDSGSVAYYVDFLGATGSLGPRPLRLHPGAYEVTPYRSAAILLKPVYGCLILRIEQAPSLRIYTQVTVCSKKKTTFFLCELFPTDSPRPKPVLLPRLNGTSMPRVSLITCPLEHVTHLMLACDPESRCKRLESSRKWYVQFCDGAPPGLPQPYFHCGEDSEEFVPYSVVCDFRADCSGEADENFCVHSACSRHMLRCGQGQCVHINKLCDGFKDCVTNLDESHCDSLALNAQRIFWNLKPPAVVSFDRIGGFTMRSLPGHHVQCPDTHFRCHDDGFCLPVFVRCNDVNDCPHHEDESGCKHYLCPGFYRCRGSHGTVCIHHNHLCDGVPQCPLHDDELMCDLICPESCACDGLAFTCTHTFQVKAFPQLRYLQARGSALRQGDVQKTTMLIHLGAQACSWTNLSGLLLPNLHSLDVSDNLLRSVNVSHLLTMPNLQTLNVANNPLSRGFLSFEIGRQLRSIKVFNVSQVQMESVNLTVLSSVLPNLQDLDLSHDGIITLLGHHSFPNLRDLDMRGCPVLYFHPGLMTKMNSLKRVFADNSKLCCSSVLPEFFRGNCSAPRDEMSCDDLLKSDAYRYALYLYAVFAVCGNFVSLIYRVWFSSERIKIGFAVFVLHLCLSDFLMGVYLVIIGAADHSLAGVYAWNETAWRRSRLCSVAGFLAFLSCEVSACLICVITLDRFLVLRFPFSRVRFEARSAQLTCILIWTLGLILATVPLLPVTSHWEFYQQTGICIPLPITTADFAGHGYSFSVMIVGNLVLFLLIALGQSLIYWSVRSNSFSDSTSKSSSTKEAVIAKRLLIIAVSDFLCWFPVGLCGLLSASGIILPGLVNVVMVIFVLPLNSALNPFLYTLNLLLEKRKKARKLRLYKFILSQLKKDSVNC